MYSPQAKQLPTAGRWRWYISWRKGGRGGKYKMAASFVFPIQDPSKRCFLARQREQWAGVSMDVRVCWRYELPTGVRTGCR